MRKRQETAEEIKNDKYSGKWERIVGCSGSHCHPMLECQEELQLNTGCTILFKKGYVGYCA